MIFPFADLRRFFFFFSVFSFCRVSNLEEKKAVSRHDTLHPSILSRFASLLNVSIIKPVYKTYVLCFIFFVVHF